MIPSFRISNVCVVCFLRAQKSSPPKKTKSKHHHHHKIIQIKTQKSKISKTSKIKKQNELNHGKKRCKFASKTPCQEAIGSWISYSLVKSQEAQRGEEKRVGCGISRGKKHGANHTVDGKNSGVNQLRWLVVYPMFIPIIYRGFMHSRWCRIFWTHQQYLIGVSWDWYNYLHLVWIFLLVIKFSR